MIVALQTLIFFRQSLLSVLDRLLQPYYKKLSFTFSRQNESDEEEEEDVFAEFDDEKGVVFYPPMYAQRYAAVSDCLMDERWCGKLEKVVDLGHHDMSFIKYLKEVPGVHCILGVDIETIPLRCSSDLIGCEDYVPKRESPLQITLFQGNAADPDYRLIGCDAVVAIEMIEHMLPHDLDRLVHTVFGFIKPWITIFTTPNADFNSLFKSLEKNGLRRLDHLFEWTREQFHDWCSNIVARYPQFTVSCKGVGPGPPGTLHYGCCSQLALFINKDYIKQQDLNLNSLALVSNVPSPHNMDNMIAGWESPPTITESNMISAPNDESMSRFEEIIYSAKQSCMTILITSPSFSNYALEYHDKTSQCNLDMEIKRNFLMFDDEDMCFSVLVPRRKFDHKVYEIEDVSCRLNCTTYQVTKFSKTTQNLMAKNKIDSLVHTREVVNEIRHLTNLLNFKTDDINSQNGRYIWHNINWGDNAPYWNQYYKIVREYNYPFEIKSEECRILDLISDEINRLIDLQYDEEYSVHVNKLEIPIDHLMKVVRHITTDVDRVKDLLEWNGYEVVDDVVIHSRLVVDNASMPSHEDDWPENDTTSEWDTSEVHSTTVSDGSTIVPDYHGRALRRALDKKVRKLRTMLSADEDITTELDRVVCRLMKLALRTSKTRQTPPPTRWMQCKLLDLLTLTEKAISRRKKHYLDSFPLKAIGFGKEELSKIQEDDTAVKIVNKYQKLLKLTENIEVNRSKLEKEFCSILKLDEDLSDLCDDDVPSNDFIKEKLFETKLVTKTASKLVRTHAWIEKDSNLELIPYPEHHNKATMSPSEHSTSRDVGLKHKRNHKKYNTQNTDGLNNKPSEKSRNKMPLEDKLNKTKHGVKNRGKTSKTRILKKIVHNKSSSSFIRNYSRKVVPDEIGKLIIKSKRKIKEHKKLQSTASKPIPGSIIELCHPQLNIQQNIEELNYTDNRRNINNIDKKQVDSNVAATEESLLVDIVMDDMEETIALRRTIGTDADFDPTVVEQETILDSVVNVTTNNSFCNNVHIATENVHSQTIFLYDINEPSTSKGVRHVGMDVQCGPDTTLCYVTLSPATSLSRMPKMFTTGIKIDDSLTNLTSNKMNSDFGTSTNYDDKCFSPISPRIKTPSIFTKGIKIGDSVENITDRKSSGTCTNDNDFFLTSSPRTKSPDIFTNGTKIEDSLNNIETKAIFDFGTCTNKNNETFGPVCLRVKSPKVRIDSSVKLVKDTLRKSTDFATSTDDHSILKSSPRKLPNATKHVRTEDLLLSNPTTGKTCDFGIFSDNNTQGNKTKSLKFATGITTEDSLTDMKNKISSDFGTCTDRIADSPRIKSPSRFTGINLGDSCPDRITKGSSNFGTSTDERHKRYSSLSPKRRSFGIKIKDSDVNIRNKADCATGTCVEVVSDIHTPYLFPLNFSSATETKLLKPISSGMKIEDSGSEFYGSCSSQKSTHLTFSSKNTSDFQIKPSVSREAGVEDRVSLKRNSRPKLSCGGVHIHSYREKQVSEDIVYQGEWQRHKSKAHARKKIINPIIVKKVTDVTVKKKRVISKEKIEMTKPEKTAVKVEQKTIQIRQPRFVKVSQELNKTEQIKKIVPIKRDYSAKINRCNKNVIKVASKLTMSSISSKNMKTVRAVKRPLIQPNTVKTDSEKQDNHSAKQYIPLYLTRRKNIADKNFFNQNLEQNAIKPVIKINKTKSKETLKAKTENVKELIKFSEEPRNNINYAVFRNEIDNIHKSASDCQASESSKENTKKKTNSNIRPVSPVSQTSSTCSTPDSIATVRAVSTRSKVSTRRHSTSSNKSSLVNSESESNTPARNRKFTKKSKNAKKPDNKENKENVPETSKVNTENESEKVIKSAFMGRNKNVFMAQVTKENVPANSLSKHKTPHTSNKSNIKIPVIDSKEKKRPRTATLSKKKSAVSDESIHIEENQNQTVLRSEISNLIAVLDPCQGHADNQESVPQLTTVENHPVVDEVVNKDLDNEAVVNEIQDNDLKLGPANTDENIVYFQPIDMAESTESTVLAAIKRIVEDQLLFIESSSTDYTDCESDALNTSSENIHQGILSNNFSPTSFKTVIAIDNNLNSTLKSDVEIALNRTFNVTLGEESLISLVNTTPTTTDLDLLSFKSITSASKLSEYFLADSEFRNTQDLTFTQNVSSVREIFERKDTPMIQNAGGGLLAIQAFSGFSMNAEPISGDQPDYVNLIDSETGSMALDTARQATSEELFISGRSSVSYDSCLIEEDSVVPNWLFQIISQQQSVTEEEPPQVLLPMPIPLPLVEPIFDVNGNMVEGNIGVGAGAGDGRGMHSDHSQDSSGRGTSLSSSESSSGQQSEAILLDPSAFTAQFELIHESIGSSVGATTLVIPLESPDTSFRAIGIEPLSTSRYETSRRHTNPLLAASDVDADVSSLDTDVVDSSDN